MAGKNSPLAFGGLIVLTLIWSYSWIAMKQVTLYIGAFDFTALRCILGAALLFIVLLLRGRGMRPTPFATHWRLPCCRPAGWLGLPSGRWSAAGPGRLRF